MLESDSHVLKVGAFCCRPSCKARITRLLWGKKCVALEDLRSCLMSVTQKELREVRGVVAELAAHNPLLQPVFDRLDREYDAMVAKPRLSKVEFEAMRRADLRELA